MYRKGVIHRTEIARPFLVAKGLNTNLVHFLLPYHVIIGNVYVCSFKAQLTTCTEVHLKRFACTKSCVQKIIIYEGPVKNKAPKISPKFNVTLHCLMIFFKLVLRVEPR